MKSIKLRIKVSKYDFDYDEDVRFELRWGIIWNLYIIALIEIMYDI